MARAELWRRPLADIGQPLIIGPGGVARIATAADVRPTSLVHPVAAPTFARVAKPGGGGAPIIIGPGGVARIAKPADARPTSLVHPVAARVGGGIRRRIRVHFKFPPHVDVRLGQECDPTTASCVYAAQPTPLCDPRSASCPSESNPLAVRMDIPAAWLDTFIRPSGNEYDEATQDAGHWEDFVTQYTTRCGMAFARLRANLVNYTTLIATQAQALSDALTSAGANAKPETRLAVLGAQQQYTLALSKMIVHRTWLDAIARGRAVLGFNIHNWTFAYVPISELPANAPTPISIDPADLGVDAVVLIVAVVALFVAAGAAAIAWWGAERAKAAPADTDADSRNALTQAQARAMDANTKIANDMAAQGHADAAAAILAMGQQRYQQDINALTQPDYARAQAEAAAGAGGPGGIADMIKWVALGWFALEAMKAYKR
jgi:hypothetical protein